MKRFLSTVISDTNPLRLLWHRGKGIAAAMRYGFPAKQLTVIGITGTDGKTTTVGMVTHILHTAGIAVGGCSTAFMQIRGELIENETHLTSVSPFALQKFLRRLVTSNCTHAVIEMSSHGLVQGRVLCTYPAIAGITNTSLEHLDYHKTMEQYRKDKGRMFHMLRGKGTKVLNQADESFTMYNRIPSSQTLTFNTQSSTLYATDVTADATSVLATIHTKGEQQKLSIPVPGTFNIENAMCALLCAEAAGVSLQQAVHALASFRPIPGRMERIDEGQDFSLYVDFAVSPKAYEKTLQALRASIQPGKRVLVLCSSCGNRMEEKRPLVGKICSELADVVVVTEDETYGEDPYAVLEEVWAGVDQTKTNAHKIFDRRSAIEFLCKEAKPGDAVALCGMGPFSTFTKLEGRIPWDEREVARSVLRAQK